MKNLILFFVLLLTGLSSLAFPKNILHESNSELSIASGGIDDGWYKARVKYSNYSTGTYETYTLNVKVSYDKVSEIDFGNGGSVHSGYNSEGYYYSGGSLYFETDYDGTISAATATVTITDTNGTRTFKIRIE